MKRIAVFASGEGTNAQAIIDHFKGNVVQVALIVCNNPNANVLNRAKKSHIPSLLINKESFGNNELLSRLVSEKIDFIVCAGFLWKIPGAILHAFPNRVVNIHPALLSKYGGKGMYGTRVHEAVINAEEKETGITIHYLNEQYDEGEIILQKKCPIGPGDTPEILAQKVHALEHEWYPQTIEQLLKKIL